MEREHQMKKINNVLLILLLLPLYAVAAKYPVDNYFCPRGMQIIDYQLKDATKSPKETWGNGDALNSIEVKNGCIKIYVGLDNQKSNVDWIKKNHPVKVSKDTVFADIYNNDKTPSKLYLAILGDITFKSNDGTLLKCDNVVFGKGNYTRHGLDGNWWLYNNSNEAGFNKKHTLRCQIADNSVNSGTYVSFSTEVINKVSGGNGWGPPTITSVDEEAGSEKKFGAPTITSVDEEVASEKKFGVPTITSVDEEVASEKKFGAPTITSMVNVDLN